MTERLTYWKCADCLGTGRSIHGGHACDSCDGTGNAFVDGATERHKRKIAQEGWPEVTKAQVKYVEALVAPEFRTGDWQTVEQEH